MSAEEDERTVKAWFAAIDPYEPTPEIWQQFREWTNEAVARHAAEGRPYVHIENRVVPNTNLPACEEVLLISVWFTAEPTEEHPVVERCAMALDDNRRAFAFYPAESN